MKGKSTAFLRFHGRRGEPRGLFEYLDDSSTDQRCERCFRNRKLSEFFHGQPAVRGAQMGYDLLLIGIQLGDGRRRRALPLRLCR